jgi:hypothetical protein
VFRLTGSHSVQISEKLFDACESVSFVIVSQLVCSFVHNEDSSFSDQFTLLLFSTGFE